MTGDTAPSIVRTVAPVVAGWLIALALHVGVHLDGATTLTAVTSALSVAYYALARVAEQHLGARWGWLLGWAQVPTYAGTTSTPSSTTGTAAS